MPKEPNFLEKHLVLLVLEELAKKLLKLELELE